MNETITRAAGASHGQETSPEEMEEIISSIGRTPRQRNTTYGEVSELQRARSFGAATLVEPVYTSAKRYERKDRAGKRELYRPGFEDRSFEEKGLENENLDDKFTGSDIV
jgi:FO synthase